MEANDNENKIEEIKETNEQQVEKNIPPKKNFLLGAIKRIIIVGMLVVLAIFALNTSKYYKNDDITDKTNVIINNNNVTARLKQEIIIENDEIYMSMSDIRNFFDNYIYEETVQDRIITTYADNIAEVFFSGNHINVNDKAQRVDAVAIREKDIIYLPISEMTNVYNIELEYLWSQGRKPQWENLMGFCS